MKKKVFCLIMGALVLSSAFAGCKITSKSSEASETSAKSTETSTASKAEETKAAEKTEKATEKPAETVAEAPATETPAEQPEKVLYEKDGLKIVYKGLGTDFIGQTIKLKIENNMGKDCIVQVNDVSVNGFMIDPLFSCDVKNGQTANDMSSFISRSLIQTLCIHLTLKQ